MEGITRLPMSAEFCRIKVLKANLTSIVAKMSSLGKKQLCTALTSKRMLHQSKKIYLHQINVNTKLWGGNSNLRLFVHQGALGFNGSTPE